MQAFDITGDITMAEQLTENRLTYYFGTVQNLLNSLQTNYQLLNSNNIYYLFYLGG
jgi:hypothetical protein